jgi:hypothetical protein
MKFLLSSVNPAKAGSYIYLKELANIPFGSLLMMNCTTPLQKLHTPSKMTIERLSIHLLETEAEPQKVRIADVFCFVFCSVYLFR